MLKLEKELWKTLKSNNKKVTELKKVMIQYHNLFYCQFIF